MAYKSPFSGMFAAAQDQEDSGSDSGGAPTSSSSGGYKSSFSGMFSKRKKKDEEEAQLKLESDMKQKEETKKAEEKKNSEKSLLDRAGDVTKGAGNFIKDAAIGIKDSAVDSYTGIKDTIEGSVAASNNLNDTNKYRDEQKKITDQIYAITGDDVGGPKWDDPRVVELKNKMNKLALENGSGGYLTDEQKKAAGADQKVIETNKKVSADRTKEFDEAQKVDAKHTAFAAADTFLNVATLGIGTGAKALGKQVLVQGGKAVTEFATKQALKEALKVGGTEAMEQIIKKGGEAAVKKAAQEVLEEGAKTAAETVAKSAGRKLAENAGKDALIGGAYGITQTGVNDPEADVHDFILNTAFGMGAGLAVPILGAGAKKVGGKVVQAITGKTAGTAASTVAGKAAKKAGDDVDPNDVNALMNKAIDEQSEKYGTGALTRVKNWMGDQVNPYRALAKIDDAYAKTTGKARHLLESGENLEDLARRSAVSEREAATLFFKDLDVPGPDGKPFKASAADLIKKYKGDSPEGMEFNNYTNAKFDLEFRGKKPGKRIQTGFDDEQLQKFVDDYEARNPDALKDAAVKKRVNDEAVDYMANAGAISKEEADTIKAAYKYAVPLERIFPDDLARPEMVGKNIGSIAKQTVIQKLEGGSDIPLSNSFDTMLNRVGKAVSQGNRAKLAQKLLERSEQGLVEGSKVLVTAGNLTARKTLREQSQLVSKGVRNLNKKMGLSNKQVKRLDRELSKLGLVADEKAAKAAGLRESAESVVPLMKETAPKSIDDLTQTYKIKDQLLKAYGFGGVKAYGKRSSEKVFSVEQMAADIHNGGWKQLRALNPAISESTAKSIATQVLRAPKAAGNMVFGTEGVLAGKTTSRSVIKKMLSSSEKDIEAVRKKIATREPKLAAKLDEVLNIKREIDSLKVVKTQLKEVTADFTDDPTTGKQVVSGLIDGEPYKMEVPPAIAKAVQGMDAKKVEGVLKAFAIIKKPFEVTWTGVFNPVFATMSYLFYDTPMSFINSPQGRKVFGPKAVIEGFKSINSNSTFQKALAAEGARPYGGSGASAFTKMDTKAIAAQRNILTKIKYTASNPEVALSKLDVWGGKLANSTRTRIARAAYDDALRIAKKDGLDTASKDVQKRAMEAATLAYRTVMPDYDTMSHLTRQVNSVVPFYAASVAGTRSFGQAIKRDPRHTLLKAGTVGLLPTVGVTAFSLMQPAGQEFYKDMEDSGNTRTLDDNLVVVLPGAHKDDETGEWKGIVKIPLAPEFRAINQTTWRSTRGLMGGDGPDASHVALSLFDTITGGVRNGENPLISTRRILSGEDPRTGEQLVKGDMANLPKEEQVYEWTSGAGKVVGKVLGTSPIQGDKILSQFGLVGQTAKNGGKPVEAVTENVKGRVSGAFGEKANESFFSTYSPIKARRDKVSKEVTDLIKAGKRNEARRKANEYNESLSGKFGDFQEKYGQSDAKDPAWDDLMSGLIIKTSDSGFNSRYKQ